MRILLTNDDGIQAHGLRVLFKVFKEAGHEVHCVAPVTEQSAVGHAVTIAMPLRVKEFKENGFRGHGVYGTPVDCVKLALSALLPDKPDLVVSGINAGANVGVDLLYSGTVSAATEGAFMGFPALAVSYDDFNHAGLTDEHGRYVVDMAERLPLRNLPHKCVLNLNFPPKPMAECKELRICRHTSAMWEDWYDERKDPRGRPYYWLTGVIPPEKVSADTDRALLTAGHVTLTPLRFDFTDYELITSLGGSLG